MCASAAWLPILIPPRCPDMTAASARWRRLRDGHHECRTADSAGRATSRS